MNHRTRAFLGAAVLTALVLTGCSSTASDTAGTMGSATAPEPTSSTGAATASPQPSTASTPTPTPTPTPSQTREDQVFAEAVQAAKDYITLATDVENKGGQGWEDLKPWWGNDEMLTGGTAYYQNFIEKGYSVIGYTTIRDAELTGMTLDAYGPSLDVVDFTFCLDSSHSERRDVDGNLFPVSGNTLNVVMTMRRTAPGNHWAIDYQEPNLEPPC